MSHSNESERAQGIVLVAWFVLGIALFLGLVSKAISEYPNETDRLTKGNAAVSTAVPVQSYGPGDDSSSGVEELYARLFAPQDKPVDCQPSTGEPLADLMLGITAC